MKTTIPRLAIPLLLAGAPALLAEHNENHLSAAAIFFEINDTDGDAGIQLFLDGEGWDTMAVFDPSGERIFTVAGDGGIGMQGMTELFFESAEPSFDEQPLEDLLALFPEGIYQFRGTSTEGTLLRGHAKLTHALPDAPVITFPGEDDEVDPNDLVVEWEGVPDPAGSRIIGYEVIVVSEEPLRVLEVDVPRGARRLEVPRQFLQRGKEMKVEILAVEVGGNKTISELEFAIEE